MQNKRNAVELVIADIEALAKNRGLYLYRYQTNIGNYGCNVTYGISSEPEKPYRSAACDGPTVCVGGKEGSTTRCRAWGDLSWLRKELINS